VSNLFIVCPGDDDNIGEYWSFLPDEASSYLALAELCAEF
jgi:hypothetical protein